MTLALITVSLGLAFEVGRRFELFLLDCLSEDAARDRQSDGLGRQVQGVVSHTEGMSDVA